MQLKNKDNSIIVSSELKSMQQAEFKKRVALIDYIGACDHHGTPIGHQLKSLLDTEEIWSDDLQFEVIAPQPYLERCKSENKHRLPLRINNLKIGRNTYQNIKGMFICLINIFIAFRKAKADYMWFYNVNQFLFVYLGLFGFGRKKIIVTIFTKEYPKKYHNYFLQKVLPNFHLVINSNLECADRGTNNIYVPDYLYIENKYRAYKTASKEEKVICLGLMSQSKMIKELVLAFNEIDYPLEICGLFYESEYYEEIVRIKKDHITVHNEYLDYKQYLEKLGRSKYCVFPYNAAAYKNNTSGIVLESIFLDVIPIGQQELMSKMEIPSIRYEEIGDLKSVDLWGESHEDLMVANQKIVMERFAEGIYKDKLLASIF